MKPRIAITLGDPAGIGPEIVSAALRDPRVRRACEPIIVGDPVAFALHKRPLPAAEMLSTPGLNRRLRLGRASREAGASAIQALRLAITLLQARQASALVTAPVSKNAFQLAGYGFPGHTEWLAKACGASEIAMLMVAGPLRAVLMTRHVPLSEVPRRLTWGGIVGSALLGFRFARHALRLRRPRLVFCGLNPHAGDAGLIGSEEIDLFQPARNQLARRWHIRVEGPVPADTVFVRMAKGFYDLAFAAYHDQGMIPLKLFAAERLVNVTLGLPFTRTSPGHGTAYDIAGRGIAAPGPMIEAILLAARYAKP